MYNKKTQKRLKKFSKASKDSLVAVVLHLEDEIKRRDDIVKRINKRNKTILFDQSSYYDHESIDMFIDLTEELMFVGHDKQELIKLIDDIYKSEGK